MFIIRTFRKVSITKLTKQGNKARSCSLKLSKLVWICEIISPLPSGCLLWQQALISRSKILVHLLIVQLFKALVLVRFFLLSNALHST